MHPLLLGVASLPLIFRLVPMVVPAHYLEPYAYWNAATLNEQDGKVETYWRNMGYWEVCRASKSDLIWYRGPTAILKLPKLLLNGCWTLPTRLPEGQSWVSSAAFSEGGLAYKRAAQISPMALESRSRFISTRLSRRPTSTP